MNTTTNTKFQLFTGDDRGALKFAQECAGKYNRLRAPHNSVSTRAMLSSATLDTELGEWTLQAGELQLADRGVLFLQDAPEFRRETIEAIGRVIHDGYLRVFLKTGKVAHQLKVPAAPLMVVATAQSCPCGMHSTNVTCSCTKGMHRRYQLRVQALIKALSP